MDTLTGRDEIRCSRLSRRMKESEAHIVLDIVPQICCLAFQQPRILCCGNISRCEYHDQGMYVQMHIASTTLQKHCKKCLFGAFLLSTRGDFLKNSEYTHTHISSCCPSGLLRTPYRPSNVRISCTRRGEAWRSFLSHPATRSDH